MTFLSRPWPWYVAGPCIGLFVPLLLLVGNRLFGVSGSLRHLCAAAAPCGLDHFRYDWKRSGAWNLAFVAGIVAGAFLVVHLFGVPDVAISPRTRADLAAMGIHDFHGLAPRELFRWRALASAPGFVVLVLGGLCVGFGTAYAGGCTSGHGIAGLADRQKASLLAVASFFAVGILVSRWLLPPLVAAALRIAL